MPTMGLNTFSLSAEVKSSFFAGESDILRDSIAEVAWTRVNIHALSGVVGDGRDDGTFLDGVLWVVIMIKDGSSSSQSSIVHRRRDALVGNGFYIEHLRSAELLFGPKNSQQNRAFWYASA